MLLGGGGVALACRPAVPLWPDQVGWRPPSPIGASGGAKAPGEAGEGVVLQL